MQRESGRVLMAREDCISVWGFRIIEAWSDSEGSAEHTMVSAGPTRLRVSLLLANLGTYVYALAGAYSCMK